MTNSEQLLKEISSKLDLICRLLALNLVKDMKVQKKQIITLHSFGFGPSEIADILDTTPNVVYVTLSQAMKKKRRKLDKKKAIEKIQVTEGGEKNE